MTFCLALPLPFGVCKVCPCWHMFDVLVYIVHVSLTSFARGCVQLPGFISTEWWACGELFHLKYTHREQFSWTYRPKYGRWVGAQISTCGLIHHIICLSVSVCQFWAWSVALWIESCVLIHSMPVSFFRCHWCPTVCMKFLSLLLLVFPSLFHLPPLFFHAGMCDMWISRQGV